MNSARRIPHLPVFGRGAVPRNISFAECGGGSACLAPCAQLTELAGEANTTIVSQRVFNGNSVPCEMLSARGGGRNPGWPVSRLFGNGVREPGHQDCYCQLSVVSGSLVKAVELDGETIGSVFENDDVQYCVLGNLRPEDPTASRMAQAESVWRRMEMVLASAGMEFTDVVRTWFFVDRILEWYGDFNAVRSRFFEERNLFDRVLAASTGVGTSNSAGAALIADVLAVRPKHGRLEMRSVVSPLQCPAMAYRSSFSRAVEVPLGGGRLLFVSGTASIAPDGRTAHVGDVEKQVALTMAVVEKILESRQMSWADVTRGIAYFKNIDQKDMLGRYCAENGLEHLPVVLSSADICRGDLLFEIEVDAVAGH